MVNPFEKPPINPNKESGDKTVFKDGEAIAQPSEEGVWRNPSAEKAKTGLDEIAEKFKEHARGKSERDKENYTLTLKNSKSRPPKVVEITHKKKAA